ncbi:MAG: DnaJ family molecular chaperone [Hyphomicrobiales bacterium]|nr:DnaJ family molecular chaperone [Hyphomicrobiales bacterium]
MTTWGRIGEIASRVAQGTGLGPLVDRLIETVSNYGSADGRRRVAFSVAMIALAAKMAKADGVVASSEVDAFRDLFAVPEGEEANVKRLFDLAKQDIAGFEIYAKRIRDLYPDGEEILEDIIDGLFQIAKADGIVHERELGFLSRVAEIFGIDETCFEQIAARHVRARDRDPYLVLGISREASGAEIKRHYRKLVAEHHPDRLIARGVPVEFVSIANDRLAAINEAYERIAKERRL